MKAPKKVSKYQSMLATIELYCKCRMPYNKSSIKYNDRIVDYLSFNKYDVLTFILFVYTNTLGFYMYIDIDIDR